VCVVRICRCCRLFPFSSYIVADHWSERSTVRTSSEGADRFDPSHLCSFSRLLPLGHIPAFVQITDETLFITLVFETSLMLAARLECTPQSAEQGMGDEETHRYIVSDPDVAVLAPVLLLGYPVSRQHQRNLGCI